MKKDKELLLIFPPQWTPISPHYAICALLGQLKENGYNASFMDLNVEFYNHILKIDYLKNINEKIKKDYVELFTKIKNIYSKGKNAKSYSLEEKCKIYKFGKIKEFMSCDTSYYDIVPDLIPFALGVIRSNDKFYTPEYLIRAMNAIDSALKMVSLAYSPTNIAFDSCYNPFMNLDFESIKHFVFDKETNIFWDFFKDKIEEIKKKNSSCVAISLNSSSQIIAGLTLAYLLKKHTKAHINIGGNFFGRIKEAVMTHNDFSMFCDSISY